MDFAVVGEASVIDRLFPQLCASIASARSIVGKEVEITAIDLRAPKEIADIAGVKDWRPEATLDDQLSEIYDCVRAEDAGISIAKLPSDVRSRSTVDLTPFDALVAMTREQESPVAAFWRDVTANGGPHIEYHLIADPPEPDGVNNPFSRGHCGVDITTPLVPGEPAFEQATEREILERLGKEMIYRSTTDTPAST